MIDKSTTTHKDAKSLQTPHSARIQRTYKHNVNSDKSF
jgi:hypothetical protein